jgi:hypothetical protein
VPSAGSARTPRRFRGHGFDRGHEFLVLALGVVDQRDGRPRDGGQ